MHPRLITTPYFVLYTFGVLFALAFVTALWWMMRTARREGLDRERIASLGLWIIIGGVLGAKLMMVLRLLPDYIANPSDLWSLATLQSAGDFYGGFFGALIASLLFFARHPDVPRWRTADICAPAIALGHGIGRIGCFMAGDDYGKPTDLPWGVVFRDPVATEIGGTPLGIPLHPVQLYESLTCFALFIFLVWLRRRKRFEGQIILAYAMLYALARFMLEYLRGDADRGFVFGGLLSVSQFIAVIVLLISIPWFIGRYRASGK